MYGILRARTLPVVRCRLGALAISPRQRRWQYNGPQQAIPHTTYFQQPPQQSQPKRSWRILRSILMSGFWFMAGAVAMTAAEMNEKAILLQDAEAIEELDEGMALQQHLYGEAMKLAAGHTAAVEGVAFDMLTADGFLSMNSDFTVSEKAIGHIARLPSNLPCEDFNSAGNLGLTEQPQRDWAEWSIFDGHAGPRTAHELTRILREIVATNLTQAGSANKIYLPNDLHIHNSIRRSFLEVDQAMVGEMASRVQSDDPDRAMLINQIAVAHSGSCALMALFDPVNSILRVANVGDSRAVLGRWDSTAGRYVAQLMSNDHTGFNPDEVERLKREHPGEDLIDPQTGRIFGLAVTRAFGDARWKWPAAITQRAHERLWGPSPRPDNVVRTPPYLTAEPEITETRIDARSEHPDFLIMASDGLWDNISSDDAVTCVQMWLDRNQPDHFLQQLYQDEQSVAFLAQSSGSVGVKGAPVDNNNTSTTPLTLSRTAVGEASDFDDTYWDRSEKTLKWHVSPKHFVVEDDHCGAHLIRNALGGSRRGLLTSVMSVQPPLARKVRDDITVQVVFFGDYHLLPTSEGLTGAVK